MTTNTRQTQAPSPRQHPAPRLWANAMLAMAIAVALGPLAARAQTPIVIQFSHVVTADTAKGKAALKFKELAEARTGGKVRVEVYPNSQLYKDREEIDALRLGAVQMLAPSLSKLAGVGGTDFEVFDLPFLFREHAAFRRVVDGPIGADLLHQLERSGIKGLAFWDNGFKVFAANRPLRNPADFPGLKMRVQASHVLVQQMQTLGSTPSVSPMINVHDALKSGALDGEENTPINIYTQRNYELETHLTVSNHGYMAYAVIVNKQFWEHLPSAIRSTLEGALRDATTYENSIAEAENARALEHLKAIGRLTVHTPDADELRRWRAALEPVYQASRSWVRPALVTAIKAAADVPPGSY